MNTINNQANITEPSILLRINKSYEEISQRFQKGGELTDEQLYEAVRGVWRVGKRRYEVKYAFAIVGGIIKEVYKIKSWDRACAVEYKYRPNIRDTLNIEERWEFTREVAEESVRQVYIGQSVKHYYDKGRNPVRRINC